MDNPSRLKQYGIQKTLLCAYRVLMAGLILGEHRKVVYNLNDQLDYYSLLYCDHVLSDYLNNKQTQNLVVVKEELTDLEDDLKYLIENIDQSPVKWYNTFPSHLFNKLLYKHYMGKEE